MFEVGDQVARVSAEFLVTALTTENNLDALRSEFGHHELRERPRACDWKIQMPYDLLQVVLEVARGDIADVEINSRLCRRHFRVMGFVVAWIVGEAAVKAVAILRIRIGR